jgi:hypothetical protein
MLEGDKMIIGRMNFCATFIPKAWSRIFKVLSRNTPDSKIIPNLQQK